MNRLIALWIGLIALSANAQSYKRISRKLIDELEKKCECSGTIRAIGVIGLMNLTYNLFRYEQIIKLGLLKIKR